MEEQNNGGFISSRVEDSMKVAKTIFGMGEKNFLVLILVVLLSFNVVQYWRITVLSDKLIEQNDSKNNQIVEEVRKQVPGAVKQEVTKQTTPIKDAVDTTTSNINKLIEKATK